MPLNVFAYASELVAFLFVGAVETFQLTVCLGVVYSGENMLDSILG